MVTFFRKRALRKALREALADDRLTDAEALELDALREELGLSEGFLLDERRKHLMARVDPILSRIIGSRRFSPEDEERLKRIAADVQISPSFGDEFRIFRALWKIDETGEFEPEEIEVDVRLNKSEVCYHECPAVWRQEKTIREHTGFVGGSIGFRVAKGTTLRLGRAVPTYRVYDDVVDISDGDFYLTSKRIVFVGDRRSTTITFGRLVNYELYRDAVKIYKSTGRPDIFALSPADAEYLDALLQVVG